MPGQVSGERTAGRFGYPAIEIDTIERSRLSERLATPARVTSLVAPAGYGKTVAVRHWIQTDDRASAWVSLDLLDDNPVAFWRDLIGALRVVRPQVDDLPEMILDQFGSDDPSFLAALLAQLELDDTPGVLVLDDIARLEHRTVLEGLALLVDRIGHQIQFVLIGRSEPRLPVARWRANGWLCEVGESHLRFTDDEAVSVVAKVRGLTLEATTAVSLSRRIEGWPAGLQLALLSLKEDPNPELAAANVAGSARLLSAYLVAEVLDRLPQSERDVALALSVVDQFDAVLCAELLGHQSVSVARALQDRGLFLSRLDDARGSMRFHPLFLEVLRAEFLWRDPARRVELHRRAAELCTARGDLSGAHHHLMSVGDHRASAELVVAPVLNMVNAGDRRGLLQLMRSLPAAMQVDSEVLALDLATGWLFAGDLEAAGRLCDRAEELAAVDDSASTMRLHTIRGGIELLSGDLESALEHVEGYERVGRLVGNTAAYEGFSTTAARVMLALGRLEDAANWIERARSVAGAVAWLDVMLPALDGWMAWEAGDLPVATQHAEIAVTRAMDSGLRPHHSAFEAFIVAGWCRLAAGDLTGAESIGELAGQDAKVLGCPWNRLRAGVLIAEVRRLTSGPRAALDVVAKTRRAPGIDGNVAAYVQRELNLAEAASLIELGAVAPATRLVEGEAESPRKRLLLGRAASRYETATVVEETLGSRAGWNLPARLEAELLIARASSPAGGERLAEALRTGASTGWVLPFVGHGQATDEFVLTQPLERLHPKLEKVLAARGRSAGTGARGLRHDLTPRELTILRLLPTHLSYAEIGTQLYLSVNTVKTNLKSLYRKLGVASRSEAVEAATRAGLA
jgi:LuxR family maltose regulon positive regulatory protein